jgi:hypothetical protein
VRERSAALQSFIDAAGAACEWFVRDPEGCRTSRAIFAALSAPGVENPIADQRLPVCAHLDAALSIATTEGLLRDVLDRFAAIAPRLHWRRRPRPGHDTTASANYEDGHANAIVLGLGGLEERADVQVGVSLLAPNVRYPDHDHPPEEVYLVLSEGEFRQGSSDWFSPGVGGSLYNRPMIRHAMRSGARPLFAMWMLRAAEPEVVPKNGRVDHEH